MVSSCYPSVHIPPLIGIVCPKMVWKWLISTDRACDLLTSASFTQVRQLKWHKDNDVIGHTTCLLTASFLALRYIFGTAGGSNDTRSPVLIALCSVFLALACYMVAK